MRENLRNEKEAMVDGVKEKIKEAASAVIGDVEQFGKVTREAASDSYDCLQKNISQLYKKGQGKVVEVEQQMEGYIKRHPMRVVLVAVGAGFLLGWLKKRVW